MPTRRYPTRRRRPTGVTIPTRVGPHVKLAFSEMRRQGYTYDMIEERSGVLRPTVKAWRYKNAPSLTNLEAVLGVLGWDLVPVPRDRVLDPEILAELKPIADRLGLSLGDAAQFTAEIVAGIHSRFGSAPRIAEPNAG